MKHIPPNNINKIVDERINEFLTGLRVDHAHTTEGKPIRNNTITNDEILNLRISLNHECWTVEQFIEAI